MKTQTKQALVVVVLLVLAIGCLVGVAKGKIQIPDTGQQMEQEMEDCDAEDWRTYDKDCGRKSPAARRSTAPAPRTKTTRR